MNDQAMAENEYVEENDKYKPTDREWSTILQIISLERENNKSTKKYSKPEMVSKILGIIRRGVEDENK